jgi:hypothetical protein
MARHSIEGNLGQHAHGGSRKAIGGPPNPGRETRAVSFWCRSSAALSRVGDSIGRRSFNRRHAQGKIAGHPMSARRLGKPVGGFLLRSFTASRCCSAPMFGNHPTVEVARDSHPLLGIGSKSAHFGRQ